MIITEQKPFGKIIDSLRGNTKVFLVGCGECATTCKTGGQEALSKIQKELEAKGITVLGTCIPNAPCVASQIKIELAKNTLTLRETGAILVFACGLGVQSVKDNDRTGVEVLPGCDTLCGAVVDGLGSFLEKCSMCGECVLDLTAGICPVTLCPKGLLNGPCGGMDKGKCEVDKERDCAWVLIYNALDKKKKTAQLKNIQPPKDYKKAQKPHRILLAPKLG